MVSTNVWQCQQQIKSFRCETAIQLHQRLFMLRLTLNEQIQLLMYLLTQFGKTMPTSPWQA